MTRAACAAVLLCAFATPHLRAQWTIQDSHTTASLRGIHAIGNGVAWASGTEGTVLRTVNDGKDWQRCAVPPDAGHLDFRGIQAFDASTAIVMSSGKGPLSRLYKTIDACQTWKLLFTNPDLDGFWDAIIMTGQTIGMLIGDPIASSEPMGSPTRWIFPTYHTTNGGLTWTRNDHERLLSATDSHAAPSESIFAASNSSMLLLPYLMLFVTGGSEGGALHYEQYTMDTAPVDAATDSKLPHSDSAGGFSIAANWALGSYSAAHDLHERPLSSQAHAVVVVGGDYKSPNHNENAGAVCKLSGDTSVVSFNCVLAATQPHGYRSSVAYDAATKTWITVGPNGTDISTDDGLNWRPLRPGAGDPPDADQQWNALSLPFVVGAHGRIGRLNRH